MDKEQHRAMAVHFNGATWRLLEREDRTEAETLEMVHSVHASLAHWLIAGTAVNEVRGLWQISRVYSEIGDGEQALRYAALCRRRAEEEPAGLKDFDRMYVVEAEARARAVSGRIDEAARLREQAKGMAQRIEGEKDREIGLSDLAAGNWGRLKP